MNKLQKNPPKSVFLSIPFKLNSPKLDLNIYFNESLITCQESSKYLGAHFDFKMFFNSNIKQVKVKFAKAVGILNKLHFYALIHTYLSSICSSSLQASASHPTLTNYSIFKKKLFALSATAINCLQ